MGVATNWGSTRIEKTIMWIAGWAVAIREKFSYI